MSNPQEDQTPKSNNRVRHRGLENFQAASGGQPFNRFGRAQRQKTLRLEPKGVSMINQVQNEDHTAMSPPKMNKSFKLLDSSGNDDSHGSNKINSEQTVARFKQRTNNLKKIAKKSSAMEFESTQTPLQWKNSSSNGKGNLIEDLSSDLEDELKSSSGSRMKRSVSKRSFMRQPSNRESSSKLPKGRSFRNLQQTNTELSDQIERGGRTLGSRKQLHNTESQRFISQPIVQQTGGQASLKIDMKFGWRPNFNDNSGLHKKEAIAIKLTYPSNPNLMRTSVRGNSNMLAELYRFAKNYRALRAQAKKINEEEFASKLIYQGYRPNVSLDLHIRYGQKASFNDESQFYDVLIPKHIKQKAIEEGMHMRVPRSPVNASVLATIEQADKPTCEIGFDSMFESGNLDLALQVHHREFNLYLRPDTNTKGYINWFFFKVTRKGEGKLPRRKITINIMNMYKKKILFKHEAKPLACSQEIFYKGFVMQELENVQWKTSPFSNIGYGLVSSQTLTNPSSKPQTADEAIDAFKNQALQPSNTDIGMGKKQKFFCLSFDFEFQTGQEFAYIAQSIPYPYTFLQKTIKTCARLDQAMTTLTRSLGGLQMPMLTITNEVINISKKRTVIICGRIHPGETNSSWILHGIIDFLISKDASHLRDNLVFKIVPMVNPDGVVAGNYRTSFIGKDLNRLYLQSDAAENRYNNMDEILKPEITAMKQLIKGCKTDDSKGILAFIDVHQHSQKRGAFMYGPSYSMSHSKYQEVRVLPKLISMMLPDMFRFQSCRFKNQSYKENCARLYCDREQGISFSFCLECSQQGYFTTDAEQGRYVKVFDQNQLMFLGRKICEAAHTLNEMVEAQDIKREAITLRRKKRNAKRVAKKGCGKSTAGRSAAKGSKGEQASMWGGTDFDNESEGYRQLNNSESSQELFHGGFNPKIGIKGFIATMMNKQPSKKDLTSDSSRGALRTKNNRPLTRFGSEDAVSEKSEKEEESPSEDGSGASSAQDLSEDEQNNVLNQVLDELMPNRIKKIEPVSAQITVTKKPEPPQLKPNRKNLKSANKIFYIDKKMLQKEQLLMPKAAPDLQVNENGQATGTIFHVASPPIEHKGVVPFNSDPMDGLQIGGGRGGPISPEPYQAVEKQTGQTPSHTGGSRPPLNKRIIQGINVSSGANNQGYISQRQNKQRIQSSKQKKKVSGDIFANQRYVPPAIKQRQQAAASISTAQNAAKVQCNNLYSIAPSQQQQQPTTAISSHFGISGGAGEIQQPIAVAPSIRTSTQLVQSLAHRQDELAYSGIQTGISSPQTGQRQISRAIHSSSHNVKNTSTTDVTKQSKQPVVKISRNEIKMQVGGSEVVSTERLAKPISKQPSEVHTKQMPTKLQTPKTTRPNIVRSMQNNRRSIISKRKDDKGNVGRITTTVVLSSKDVPMVPAIPPVEQQPPASPYDKVDRKSVPLNQGGFFHRNQVLRAKTEEDQFMGTSLPKANLQPSSNVKNGVVIRHKPSTSAFINAKRNSAVIHKSGGPPSSNTSGVTSTPLNRITHKRQSQQMQIPYQGPSAVDQSKELNTSARLEQMTTSHFGMYQNYNINNLRKSHAQVSTINQDLGERGIIGSMDQSLAVGSFLRSPVRTSAANLHFDSGRQQYSKTTAKTQALMNSPGNEEREQLPPQQPLMFSSNIVQKHQRQQRSSHINLNQSMRQQQSQQQPRVNIRATSAQKYNKIGHGSRLITEHQNMYSQAWMHQLTNQMAPSAQVFKSFVEHEAQFN